MHGAGGGQGQALGDTTLAFLPVGAQHPREASPSLCMPGFPAVCCGQSGCWGSKGTSWQCHSFLSHKIQGVSSPVGGCESAYPHRPARKAPSNSSHRHDVIPASNMLVAPGSLHTSPGCCPGKSSSLELVRDLVWGKLLLSGASSTMREELSQLLCSALLSWCCASCVALRGPQHMVLLCLSIPCHPTGARAGSSSHRFFIPLLDLMVVSKILENSVFNARAAHPFQSQSKVKGYL